MGMARKVRLMHNRSKLPAGEFLVDFFNLGRKAIICPALADEARNLSIGFQHRADRLDPSLCLLGRALRQSGADLFPQDFEECLLVVQNRCNGTRTVTSVTTHLPTSPSPT